MEAAIQNGAPQDNAAWIASVRSRRAQAVLRAAQQYQLTRQVDPVMPEPLKLARMKTFGIGFDPNTPYFGIHFRTQVLHSLNKLVDMSLSLGLYQPPTSSRDMDPRRSAVRMTMDALLTRYPQTLDRAQCERCVAMFERALGFPANMTSEVTESEYVDFERDMHEVLSVIEPETHFTGET